LLSIKTRPVICFCLLSPTTAPILRKNNKY
jgi:hypothetical protein